MNAKVSATKVCPGCSARYPPDALFCPNDGSPLTASTLEQRDSDAGLRAEGGGDSYLGREIGGHIEIRKLAGVGAMGRVYRAFQRGIDRDVAVKVLHRELSANQQLVARFHREAKVASRLSHPNVVQVHLAGQLPDGAMYIVMEYLDGLSLQSALAAAGGPITLDRALHIALQICDATGEGHSQGVIHRDIKPENVMLVRRGDDPDFVKVLDFGIARLNWGEQSMATAAGLIFGTARYISPEGAQGEAVGPEGDVYAIATLLYQMLAGRTPFEGEQAVALLVQQIHDTPPAIRDLPGAGSVPEPIARLIMSNLAKSPSDRASDARVFGRALVEAAKNAGLSPEDLGPRSSLFVPKPRLSDPGPVGVARSAAPIAPSSKPVNTTRDIGVPDFGAILGAAAALPPGTKTQTWTPPSTPGVGGTAPVPLVPRLAAPPPPPPAAEGDAPRGSSVDRTLDDVSEVKAPPSPLASTVSAPPDTVDFSPIPAPPAPVVASSAQAVIPAAPHRPVGRLTDVVEESEDGGPAPRSSRIVGVVIICFLVGMLAASLVLYQLGWFAAPGHSGSLDDVVLHGDEALKHARWDAPLGDNVRDITNDGLARWPHNSRLLDIRARATDELVKEAVGRKFAGDQAEALHLARLANELDPSDTTAQHLVEEYGHGAPAGSSETPAVTPSSTVTATPPPHGGGSHAAPGVGGARVAVDASVARPKVGQPVSFTARFASGPAPKSVEEPRFTINGPGLTPDTRLGAVPQSAGAYSATFTGFEPGKYEVTFDAKADGATVRGAKTIVVEGEGPPPGSGSSPAPPPVPSGKWM